jgi:AcrR family transcriptional regulator
MEINTKKDKLLQVALRLFHQKGYKATTLREIAKELNYEVANIYNYIHSKHSILEYFLFKISADFHSSIDNVLHSNYSPIDKLKAIINLHVSLSHQKPHQIGLLVNEWRNLKEPELERFKKERSEYESKVKSIVEVGIKQKVFRKMDAEIATLVVLSSVRWIYDWYASYNIDFNPIEHERQIFEIISQGLIQNN